LSQCQACDSEVRDTYICPRCESDTRARLQRQGFYYRQLLTVLTRMTRTEALNDGGRAASLTLAWAQMGDRFLDSIEGAELARILASLPPARRAANAMHSQRSLLVSWCRLLHEDAGITLPADLIATMGHHLANNLHILRKHEAAGELVHEIRALETRIVQVIDLPTERTRIKVGPCPNTYPDGDGDDTHCIGEIEAVVPVDVTASAYMKCGTCRAEWPSREWYITGPAIQARKAQLDRQKHLAAQFIGKAAR
jgi:hypothetical protein